MALEGAYYFEQLPLRTLRSRFTLFEGGTQAHDPHSSGPVAAEAEQ